MHEVGLVRRIHEQILKSGKTRKATVVLGALKSVDEKSFKTIFSELAERDSLKEMQIKVKVIPLKVKCSNCGFQGIVEDVPHLHVSTFEDWPCPKCGEPAKILSGTEERVEDLE
jgi:Zn finger protein HypA/HybF involved in hydrogenase expression